MPKVLETDVGEIEFPDDFTLDQINEWGRTELPNLRQRVGKGLVSDLASRFPRDVATSGADTIMGAARGWQELQDYGKVSGLRQMGAFAALTSPVGEEHAAITAANEAADAKAKELEATREQRLAGNPVYKFGAESKKNAQEFYQTNPLRDSSIPAMITQGVASLPPMIAAGAAGPLAPVVAGLAYGAMSGQQGAQEAIDKGQPEKADEAYLAFAGLGAISEFALGYPIALLRTIRAARQAGVDPVRFGQTVKQQIAKQGVEGFLREAAQEGTEQTGQNLVASTIVGYDPNRPVMQGVPQAAAIGGVVGGGLGTVSGAAMAIDEARARARVPAMLSAQPTASTTIDGPFIPATPEQRAAEAAGLPIPLTPAPTAIPSMLSPIQPSAEQLAAEEAAAVAAIRARQPQVEPYFSEAPATTPAPPASAPPRFRPPLPQAEPPPAPTPAPAPRRRSPAIVPESDRPFFRPTSGRDLTAVQPLAVEARPIAGTPPPLTGPPEAANAPQPEATTKGVEPVETPVSQVQQGEVGGMLGSGEVRLTSSGRETTPFPKVATDTNRKATATVKKVDAWLRENAIAEANARGDDYNSGMFGNSNPKSLSQADKDSMEEYLFGQQPAVVPSILKPLSQPTQPQEPNAGTIRSPETLLASQQTVAGQEVVPQIRDAERPSAPQTETPKAQGNVDWFANLGSVNPEELARGKDIQSDIRKLNTERQKLGTEIEEINKRVLKTTGPRWERGKVKKSANNADIAERNQLIKQLEVVVESLSVLHSVKNPAEIEAAIRTATDTTKPLLLRMEARRQLYYLQGQPVNEQFNADFDVETRKEVRRLFPDASPAEEERLRSPVLRAYMGRADIQNALRLDPELNLNVQRWGEIQAIPNSGLEERFPEHLQAKLQEARNLRISRKTPPPITRSETDQILSEIPKALEAARAEALEEQRQAEEAAAKMEREFTKAIKTETASDAKAAKSILVRELESAISVAPDEQHGKASVTIEIPGDGTFRISNNKVAIQTVLDNARKLSTSTARSPGFTQKGVTKEQGKQFAEEARMTPEEIAEFESGRSPQKLSVTLSEPPTSSVTRQDIERAFPSAQGFTVKPVAINWVGSTPASGYLVGLPNKQLILIDPTHDRIAFDANKAAADWGLDPATVAEFGVARGGWTSGGVTLNGLQSAGLIDLLNTSGPDILSHEKFHALFELALTPDERATILNRYKTEEKAAEAFRRSEGFTRGFWDKMQRFIEWLANLVRGDAFRKLKQPLSATASQPTGRTEGQYSLQQILSSKKSLEDFVNKPTISAEEQASLRKQAGAGSGLVPDAIAREIQSLNPDDTVEERVAGLLDFVLKLHGVAPALELKRILADSNIAEDTKQAAISNVLIQIERVQLKASEYEDKLQESNAKLESVFRLGKKITAERLVEARSKQIAGNLISRYRSYLTAQAASMPANQNIAASRTELINGMMGRLDRNQSQSPDAVPLAIEAIAQRIDELPVNEGPQAVIDAIRLKDILRGKVDDSTIGLLTSEKPGGLPPLLLNPDVNAQLIALSNLQKKAETYAKQIEVIEQAFRGQGDPTPVQLKKFADTYRKFRNKQADAAKAIRDMDQQIQEADDNVQVYGRSHDLLTRLQNDPQFKQQFEAAINRPGGEIFRDVLDAKNPELEKEYTSPLVQESDDGKKSQNKYRVKLAPDRVADEESVSNMQMLVAEIDEFLQGDVNPVERQTWETRRDYIIKYLLQPKFSQKTQMLQFGRVNLNPFGWVQLLFGGRARGPRTELEKMAFRAANEANTTFRTADQALVGYKLISNNRKFGDAATKVATLKAVASHKNAYGDSWSTDRITFWDENVLNPILASGQTAGQMRLKAGDFIPGTGIKITKEDMDVAQKQKRYSQGIVQTTQGTAKGLPGLLVENPILIKTKILGRKALRGAISPGPFTMARRFSTWSKLFSAAWTKTTPEGRRRMVADGEHFQKAILGYVSTTNPEFNNTSPYRSVYETFTARAKEDENYQVNSLDQLVDRLAAIAVEQKLFPSRAEAMPKIEEKLLSEIGEHVSAIQKHFAEEGFTDDTPQTVMQYASAKSAFTTARTNMLAPDSYYDYTLTHDSDRIGFVAAGYQQFQLRQIDALKSLKVALDRKEGEFKEEIGRLRHKGMSARKASAIVQKKSETQLDRTRFSMLRLHAHKRVIEKVLKDLSENVIDVRDPNDSIVLTALQRVTSNLSSSLLSSPTALANNLFGGIAANSVILRNLGRASLIGTPVKATAHTTSALVKKVLLTFAPQTVIGKVARSNMPIVKDMAAVVDNQLRNWTQQYLEMQERGLVAPTDMRNRMRAQSALRTSAGAIEREPTPLIAAIPNWLESIPGIQQFLGHLRDKVPRVGDEVVNMGAAGVQTSEVFDFLKLQAVKAFEAREAAGDDINSPNYFTKEENLLSPKELGMFESTGFRDSDNLRQMFEIVGNLDGFLLDYYNRQKSAAEGQKHAVPLFENPADEGAVLYDMNAHGNIATAGFTPPSMAGVGQRGLIKKMLFMFQNYVLRQAAQAERLADKDLRDPKGWREAYALWGIFATLIVWSLAGMLATETGVPLTKIVTGRSPSRVTAANVIADPDAAMLARYVGMALGNNLPYYGQVISQMLGNPGYGSKWDAANLIPIAGLVRDVNTAITSISQTGDPIFPAVDFLNRWMPPVSPALRLLPGVEGDIEARNAARALRVVGPSEGMDLAGGGGGQTVQTPASAAVRRLISAAYRGDAEGIQSAFDAAVAEKRAQGSPDPEKSVLQSLASKEPARGVFGRAITSAEEARLIGRMSGAQRAAYSNSQNAFSLINQTLGTNLKLTSEPKARSTTRGQASRRALFTGSASPIFGATGSRSRRRRLGGRRRSPFSRLRIRGASRRKRRSPARFSFAQ